MMDGIARYLSARQAAALLSVAVLALAGLLAGCVPEEEPRPPILLNDPPPPVHTGGEPYPPGTFPPEVAPLWANSLEHLRRIRVDDPLCTNCSRLVTDLGQVHNQWLFVYDEELDDPEAAIGEQLRAAGAEYEAITVRTREHYEQYDPKTFYNWLSPDNSRFDPLAAFERLGGELHPDASFFCVSTLNETNPMMGLEEAGQFRYQVKLHGLREGDAGKVAELPSAYEIEFHDPCWVDPAHSTELLPLLAGGLYTTFGDDLVLILD